MFKNVQNHFAFAETIEEHAHRAQVDAHGFPARPDGWQCAVAPPESRGIFDLIVDLIFNAEQTLDSQGIAQIIIQRGQIVHAVGQDQRLMVCLASAVFSMPVCRKPISGTALTTVSPSIVTMRRSTPWVLGCWGPILIVISIGLRCPSSRAWL